MARAHLKKDSKTKQWEQAKKPPHQIIPIKPATEGEKANGAGGK